MRGQISIFDGTQYSLENQSIKLIQDFEQIALQRNPRGYVVGYSGGKDSDVLLHLFKRAGVKYYVIHNHTTIDLPDTVYYVRRKFYELECQGQPCDIFYPNTNFWSLCLNKGMLPLRQFRFCCAEFKEYDIPALRGAVRSFGVRRAESVKRKLHRDSIETRNRVDYKDIQLFHFDDTEKVKQTDACYRNNYFIVNPIAYWSNDYELDYIEGERLSLNPLYNEGFERVGCMLCPMAKVCNRQRELEKYPKFGQRFIKLADDIIQKRNKFGLPNKYKFKSGVEYFDMWLNNKKLSSKEEIYLLNFEEWNF